MLRNGIVWTLIVLVFALGCAKRPVLYPNDHLESVGKEASQHDIDVCMALAKDADLGTNQTLEAGKKTGAGAAVGTATGAVSGAFSGDAGTGALIGLSVGALGGLFSWIFGSGQPDPVFVQYVDRCLSDRGYEPIGWK